MSSVEQTVHSAAQPSSMNPESAHWRNIDQPSAANTTQSRDDTPLRVTLHGLRAHGLKYQDKTYSGRFQFVGRVKRIFGRRWRFVVTATDGVNWRETAAIKSKRGFVSWGGALGEFTISSSSPLVLRIFKRRGSRKNVHLGTLELSSESLSQTFPHDFDITPSEHLSENLAQQMILRISVVTATARVIVSAPVAAPGRDNLDKVLSEGTVATSPPATVSAPVAASDLDDTDKVLSESTTITPPPAASLLKSPSLTDARRRIGGAKDAVGNMQSLSKPAAAATDTLNDASNIADQASDLYSTWGAVVNRMAWVVDITGKIAEVHPYAKMAWSILSFIPRELQGQIERDRNIASLLQAILDAFDIAEVANTWEGNNDKVDPRQVKVLEAMVGHCCDCGDFIQSYARNTKFRKRLFDSVVSGGEVDKTIKEYCAALARLKGQLMDLMTATAAVTVGQVQDEVQKISGQIGKISNQMEQLSNDIAVVGLDVKIMEIAYGPDSSYKRSKRCFPGTRKAFLEYIVNWVNDPESTARTLVLFGQAGTGKSSIAHEIACRFDDIGRLTCSYFFVRKERKAERSNDENDAYQLFTTLARDLSDLYPSFKTALGRTRTSLRKGTTDYETLFSSLLLEPLSGLNLVRPIFVVIDALDESGDVTSDQGLHKFLADNASKLPSNLRILVTSRPENDIVLAFNKSPSTRHIYMNDVKLSVSTDSDILAYCTENLPEDARHYAKVLAAKAEGLFQWAAAACAYIKRPPPGLEKSACVDRLLGSTAGDIRVDPLDKLYLTILESYFDLNDPIVEREYQSIMGQFFAAFEPLSILSLASLRRHVKEVKNGGSVYSVVRDLGSLLSNVASAESSLPVVPLHTSFRDFLTDKKRSGVFYLDINNAHRQLALDSLDLLANALHLNICDLIDSHQANKDVEDLPSRVEKHIPFSLSYACRLWDDHLVLVAFDDELLMKLRKLFGSPKLLYWIEALSLLGRIGLASQALTNLASWLFKSTASSDLGTFPALVNDALKFVEYFGMPVTYSTPHLYLSALPFTPRNSHVFAECADAFPNLLLLKRGRLPRWPEHVMTIRSLNSECHSVAFSPDGRLIASGLSDWTVRVWDSVTGEAVGEPLQGHEHSVRSVTFSPDGRRIASGSYDKTIRVWDAATGKAVGEPFQGHGDWVHSVAFSPDGCRIASGSDDWTIRVWDAATGEAVGEPFRGHERSVLSVTFSPDGRRIASGSSDSTIRVWNAETGKAVGEPSRGHHGWVRSVTFSPDGRRIASGSDDKTIRVWDSVTGEAVGEPFWGHEGSVRSVTFSPDGHRIASGSHDKTVRVWGVATGEAVGEPFRGHERWVQSVTFSPDGRRITSGSHDKTIRVWDAAKGEAVGEPFRGHEHSVQSVAFSPDGRRITSGSSDWTIRVWDAATGEAVGEPFRGHERSVLSVAFSPDGCRIASGSFDETIRVWDAATGDAVGEPFRGHKDWVLSVAFSPDGRRIASGSSDWTIRVWDAVTGKAVREPFRGHGDWVRSVTFSPDGRRITSGSHDKTIRVWDAVTGKAVGDPFRGHEGSVRSVTSSPDGHRIASGSPDDWTIRVWDAATGEAVGEPFRGHEGSVNSVTFSPDGCRIASGSDDWTIRVWDAATGEAVGEPFRGHEGSVLSVAFSPDRRHIASGSDDRTVRMWHVDAGATTTGVTLLNTTAGPTLHTIDPRIEDAPALSSTVENPQPASRGTTDAKTVDFIDFSVIDEDGWIRGGGGKLLVWIPQAHRARLHCPSVNRPGVALIWGKGATQLDLSRFVHGPDWATRLVHRHS